MFCLNLTRSTPCPSDPSIFFKLKDNHLFIFKNSKSKAVYVFVCVGVCVQSLKLCPCLFETPWAAAHQASLSFIIFQSLLRLMSIETAMPSNHLILCRPLLLPSIFTSLLVFPKGWQAHKWIVVKVNSATRWQGSLKSLRGTGQPKELVYHLKQIRLLCLLCTVSLPTEESICLDSKDRCETSPLSFRR